MSQLLTSFSLPTLLFASLMVVAVIAVSFLWKINRQFNDSKLMKPQFEKSEFSCYENAYKFLPDAIVVLNSESKFIYINPTAEKLLGCKLRSVMSRSYKDIFDFQDLKTKRTLQGLLSNGFLRKEETVLHECLLQTIGDKTFPVSLNLASLVVDNNNGSSIIHSLMTLKNITERKAIESKLSDLEKFDTLTRMLNRRSFEIEVKHLIDSTYKHNSMHVLAYFSIDQFQMINDTAGYASGDSLIIKIGDMIRSHINKSIDIIGRVSDDEFAVVFRELKLASAIKEIEAMLSEAENIKFTSMGSHYSITLSAGFVIIDSESTSSARVISEANTACNLAKKNGGNHLYIYKSENTEIKKLEGDVEWVLVLKKAIQENQFQMYAQPIHPLKLEDYAQPFFHYELLIRLFDEKQNSISPDEFLSAAEYYSMMPEVDRWVVRYVLQKISKIPDQTPLPVFAINLSGQSLNDPQFLDFVVEEVKASKVDPQMLCFEITEQVLVDDLRLVNDFISSLKSLGSKFSLDDFGSGSSSYNYLRSLKVDYLKIDGSFVKNIVDDDVAKAMVQSINYVGHTMNLKVIAEYVENEKILNSLRFMGVDYGQGYQILRPVPFNEVLKQHFIDDDLGYTIES